MLRLLQLVHNLHRTVVGTRPRHLAQLVVGLLHGLHHGRQSQGCGIGSRLRFQIADEVEQQPRLTVQLHRRIDVVTLQQLFQPRGGLHQLGIGMVQEKRDETSAKLLL